MSDAPNMAAAQKRTIMLCAVEPSADALGAQLITAMRAMDPKTRFVGCGGPKMAALGFESHFSIDPFSVIGPVDALMALPAAMSCAAKLADLAATENIDAAVLIDGWGFARITAPKIKRAAPSAKLFKFVAPQVWASRPKRAEAVAQLFDGVLTLFEFETPWFEKHGVNTKFVGHPGFQAAAAAALEPKDFSKTHGLDGVPLLGVLPGSRKGEVTRLTPVFAEAVAQLLKKIPNLRIVIPVAPAVENLIRDQIDIWPVKPILVSSDQRYDVYRAIDAALAASGTVTTELAISGTPMVVGYKAGAISWAWVRHMATQRFVSMVNIASDRAIIPEFLQEECLPAPIAEALTPLLSDTPERQAQIEAFPASIAKLGASGPPAAHLAAETIFKWMSA